MRIRPLFWKILLVTGLVIHTFPPALFSQQRVLFRDLPPDDPKSIVIQRALRSSSPPMRSLFNSSDWRSGHYGGAWERAHQYFPNHVYYTESQQHFMTHGFSEKGQLYMEIYNAAFLRLSVANLETFTNGNIVSSYNRMLADDPQAARAFQEKLGRLESYFRDEASKNKLKKMLGSRLFNQLLKELREENDHMFAGALLHEGMHAKMDDDALVARTQNEYNACNLPVQWDELRSYMAEISYHARFYSWAVGNIQGHWRAISDLLRQLERFRRKPKPLSDADKEKIEQIKVKIKAHIAFIRLRMRELWQSTQRMNGMMAHFQNDYVKDDAPEEHRDMIDKLTASIASFVKDVGETIQRAELMLRALEQSLDLWNEWASCRRPDPPDKGTIDDIIKRFRGLSWPSPPVAQAEEIRKKADKEIGKIPGSPIPGMGSPGGFPGGRQGLIISGGFLITSTSMTALNDYLDYLNRTWGGAIPHFEWENGFRISLGWRVAPHIETGAAFERLTAAQLGSLTLIPSDYASEHTLNMVGVYVTARTGKIAPRIRLTAQAGAGYYTANYTETENTLTTEGRDGAIGWNGALGVDFDLGGNMALTTQAGYRKVKFDEFGVAFFSPENPPVQLDFSGFYGHIGLSFRFQ